MEAAGAAELAELMRAEKVCAELMTGGIERLGWSLRPPHGLHAGATTSAWRSPASPRRLIPSLGPSG